MLRQLGMQFDELKHDAATTFNVPAFPQTQRVRLGKAADYTEWLEGGAIVKLVTLDNPDRINTHPTWLSGPSSLDHLYTFFAQTLAEAKHRGRVRIMVVNTDEGRSVYVPG